jgi:cytochrome P450
MVNSGNQREMMNPAFAHTNLKKAFDMMVEATQELVENMRVEMQKNDYVHIDPIMTHVTADIIFRTILSQKLSAQDAHNIHAAFNKYQEDAQHITQLKIFKLPKFFLENKLKKSAAVIHDLFKKIIQPRYDEFHHKIGQGIKPENKDILDALMLAKHPVTGKHFDFKELIDQLSIIFLAGHETSASALTWSLYLVAQCVHMQDAIYNEVNSVMQDGIIAYENVKQLKMTSNLFEEALRLYPPVSFFPREAMTEMEMRNKKIKKGDMIVVSPWLLHRNANYWQEAHTFNPDRFEDETQKDTIKNCYMPFGKGQRICIGAGFARQEASLVLAYLLYHFKVSIKTDHNVEPVSRMTTRPKDGVFLKFEVR